MTNISVEEKVNIYLEQNPELAKISRETLISIMVKNGALSLSEAQKVSAFAKTGTSSSEKGTKLERGENRNTAPFEQTPLTTAQAQDLSIDYLSESLQSTIDIMRKTDNGIISEGYDSIKNILGTELSSKNVGDVLDKEYQSLTFLQKARDGRLTKKEYYEQNKERLKEMIMKRFERKDETGVSYLDKLRGNFSEEEFTKILDEYITQTTDSISTMKGIKDVQHKLIMLGDEETADFISKIARNAKTETLSEFSIEGQNKKLPRFTPDTHPFDSDEPMTFEETFELERGTKFDKKAFENLQQSKGEMSFATGAYNKTQELRNNVKLLLDEYAKETKTYTDMDGNTIGGNEPPAADRADKISAFLTDYYAVSPESAKNDLASIITKQKLDLKISQDENGKLTIDFGELYKTDAQKNRALNTLLKVSVQEQDNKLTKLLGGKSYESYLESYQNDYKNALGKENADELAKAMRDDQMTVVDKYSGLASMGGMAVMCVGGILTLTPAAPLGMGMVATGGKVAMAGMAAKNILGFTEELSRDEVSDERMTLLKKNLAMDIGGLIIGGAAGRQGMKYASQILQNGGNKALAVLAEKGTDFTLSAAGDLAMIGALNYDEGLAETLKNNGIGIVVSTITGLKASKELFKGEFEPQLKPVFAAETRNYPHRTEAGGGAEGSFSKTFSDIKTEVFNLKEPLENILNEHDLYIINGSYNDKMPEFIKAFYESDNLESFKERANYYYRANLIDNLPQSTKEKFKARGIDLDKMNAVIKEDLDYDYNRKLPSQASFDKLFNILADNKNRNINPETAINDFLTKINPNADNASVQKVIKDYDTLTNSPEFEKLSNSDKTVAKTVQILNSVETGDTVKDITTLVNNLSLPKDTKNRILNLVVNKNLLNDLANGKADLDYAAAVLRDKRDLNIAFGLAENKVSDKTALNTLYKKLVEKVDKNIATQGSPVMQTFITPDRFKTDEKTGVQYARSNENDVFLVHSVSDFSDSPAEKNIASLLKSLDNPSEKNYLSTSLITEKSEVFANTSAYGIIVKNRGKNTINAGIGQISGYNHTFESFVRQLNNNAVSEDSVLVKQYFKDSLEQSGVKLTYSEYVKLLETINNKQYFSQLKQDVDIDGKIIKADVLRNAAESANKKLADKILYGEGGNNEVTSLVDGVEAIYARVDDISEVKPEIMQLAKENNLKVILLGKPSTQKKDITDDINYQSELAVLTEKFKNKEISAPQFMAAKKALKTKYQSQAEASLNHSSARISGGGGGPETRSLDKQNRGPVLEGGVRADELEEVAPFAQRLENPPHVGDYIDVPETKFILKEFRNNLAALKDKNGKSYFDSDYTIKKLAERFGKENLSEISANIDEIRTKFGDEFTANIITVVAGNNKLKPDKTFSLIKNITNEFNNTPENCDAIESWIWYADSNSTEAAQILLAMPKRENSMDDPWTNVDDLLTTAANFDDEKSIVALKRAVSLKSDTGANMYNVKDIDTIKQTKDLLASKIYTDEEIKDLKYVVIGLLKNTGDLEDISKVLVSPESKDIQAQVKNILKNEKGMNKVAHIRQLQPQVYEKVTEMKMSASDVKDKQLKSLIKRNIKKINDPQKRIEFIQQMKTWLPNLSEVKDKYILGKIHGETAKIVEWLNTKGITVDSSDYSKLRTYIDIDKEFHGEETYSYGNATEYLSYMEKEYPDDAQVFKDLIANYQTMSEKEFEEYFNTHSIPSISMLDIKNYIKDKKIQTLKNYMRENQEGDPTYSKKTKDNIKRLYKEKYLTLLPKATRERCEKIYDSFGVKMFLANENDTASLDFIYNELMEWQKASKGKAVLPPTLDLSVIKQGYIDKVFKSGGYHETYSHNISLDGRYLSDIKYALRHEIAHANDSKITQKDGIITVYNKDGSTEDINIDEIIVHKMVQATDDNGNPVFNLDGTPFMVKAKADDGTFDPDLDKCKYVEEFENAGIPYRHIPYAYTNKAEFLAVAAEGDYSKYSKEFKELLVKLGLPDWMFKMNEKNSVGINANIYTNEKFSNKYTLEENRKISAHSEDFYNWVVRNKDDIETDYRNCFGFLAGTTLQHRVKDLNGLNEKIYREIDRLDEKIADLSDIDKFNAEKLKKGDEPLTQEAADILIEKYNAEKQSLINDYDTVRNTIQDAYGARLVMDDTSPAAISKVHRSLLNAVDSGEIKLLEINNYQGEGGVPYFSSAQIKQLQAHCRRQGYEMRVISDVNAPKGKENLYSKNYNSPKAVKSSGYTTCQINIQHKNGVISEFQIRGKHINKLAESEHIFYDISQKKDLSKGNPAIKQLTDPLVKVVEEMNAKGNEHIKEAYSKYLTECYKYARMQELGIPIAKPSLPPGVDPMLDIDNIIRIHSEMEALK